MHDHLHVSRERQDRSAARRISAHAEVRAKTARQQLRPAFEFEYVLGTGALFYAAWGTWTAYRIAPALIVYLSIYCLAFGVVALWGVRDTLAMQQAL